MPVYYVYNARTGDIIHRHEAYSGITGEGLICTEEEVLSMIDESLRSEGVQVLEVEAVHPDERIEGGRIVRVDVNTGQLTVRE